MSRGRRWRLARVAAGVLALPMLYAGIYGRYHIEPTGALSAEQARRALGLLRRIAGGEAAPADVAGSWADHRLPGPLWVTLYDEGVVRARLRSDRSQLSSALVDLARRLADKRPGLSDPVAARGRLKLDLMVGSGPLITSVPLLFAMSVVPGRDGLSMRSGTERSYLLPDDLYRDELLTGYQPFYFMPEFRTGLDLRPALAMLRGKLSKRTGEVELRRFRVQSFVESTTDKRALAVDRYRVVIDQIDRDAVRRAVINAADYVVKQLRPDGRFHYMYYPLHDQHSHGDDYSLPRHAGTTWFVSLAYRKLHTQRYGEAARRAIRYLGKHAVPSACRGGSFACVGSDAYASLGSAALAVVAITEYQRATGDRAFGSLARRLGSFILEMQKPNGDFCHQYEPRARRKDCDAELLYYSGEAALALAKLLQLTRDARYAGPLERALDFLVGEKYDFFMGQFFISEDHWTCIAADAAYPRVKKKRYLEFCRAFARINRRVQIPRGSGPFRDLWGGLAVTPFFMPHNTPAGSRTEADTATYLLSQHWGESDPQLLAHVRAAVRYLVDQQLVPERRYLLPDPQAARGAMLKTPVRPEVRIDYVQHAAAAMIRALPLIPREPWPGGRGATR